MRRLKVPVISVLDVLDITSTEPILEVQPQRGFLTHANWHEYPYKPITAFNIARTEKDLYIRHSVQSDSLKMSYEVDNSSVHEDSCVEFFMKKEGDSRYMSFEFNCVGACGTARYTSRDIKASLSQEEYKGIIRLPSARGRASEETKGIHTWNLAVVIPLKLIGLDPSNLPEKILGNFYKCVDEAMNPHFASWSPTDLPEPNFYCPEFFREIYL